MGQRFNARRALLQLLALIPLPLVVAWIYLESERPPVAPVPKGGGAGHGASSARGAGAAPKLPASFPSGWKLKGPPTPYDRKTLYDRINGAAPAYLRAGFVGSQGAEYGREGLKDTVMVDVYDMGSAARALGMYATERDPSYKFCEAGDEAYLASGSLNMWLGRYYVKLAGFEVGEAMDAALKELAVELAGALPAAKDRGALDEGLASLPAEGQLPRGAGYAHAALADVTGLERVFTRLYAGTAAADGAADPVTLFAVKEKDAGAVSARVKKALAYFKGFEATVERAAVGQGAEEIVIRGEGAAHVLVQRGPLLGGAVDLTGDAPLARARALLRKLGEAPAAPAKGGAKP